MGCLVLISHRYQNHSHHSKWIYELFFVFLHSNGHPSWISQTFLQTTLPFILFLLLLRYYCPSQWISDASQSLSAALFIWFGIEWMHRNHTTCKPPYLLLLFISIDFFGPSCWQQILIYPILNHLIGHLFGHLIWYLICCFIWCFIWWVFSGNRDTSWWITFLSWHQFQFFGCYQQIQSRISVFLLSFLRIFNSIA